MDYETLGKNIKKYRLLCGMRQEDLAEECGCSNSHIGHIENHRTIPSLEMVVNIANALGVTIDRLLSDSYLLLQEDDFNFEEERLANAYAQLPLLRKQILKLLFVDNLKVKEIARMLNCSPNYVSDQKRNAIKALRKKLIEGGDENG